MNQFNKKVTVVTGSGQGIGKGIAIGMAEEGATVIVVDLISEKIKETVDQIKEMGGEVLGFQVDVSNKNEVSKMVEDILREFKTIDNLVNNAGISVVSPTIELDEERWDKGIDINLKSTFLCSQAVAPMMVAHGGGKILNIASVAGISALPERAAYCSSKAGVIQLTKVLAIEWAKYNIRVNAIAPGITKTSMIADLINKGKYNEEILIKRIPLKRLASIEDIVNAALFLLSQKSDYITGIVLPVDGGWTAYGYL